ncbi:MAG: DMT family transporter [bacterium]
MNLSHAGELAALGTAVCWTVTSLSFEAAGRRIGSLTVNLVRLLWAVGLLAGLNLVLRGHAWPTDAPPEAWKWLVISGLIGFAFGDLCLFRAFVDLGARMSMLIMALVPPMTALVGMAALGERLSPVEWLGLVLTVGGVAWVVRERAPDASGRMSSPSVRGILLALGGAAGQAVGLVFSKIGMREYPDPFAANQIRVVAGSIGFALVFTAMRRWPRFVAGFRNGRAQAQTLLGAIFGPFAGVSLSLLAVRLTEAGIAATLMSIVPILLLPIARLRGEVVTRRATIGAFAAVVGCALLFLGDPRG